MNQPHHYAFNPDAPPDDAPDAPEPKGFDARSREGGCLPAWWSLLLAIGVAAWIIYKQPLQPYVFHVMNQTLNAFCGLMAGGLVLIALESARLGTKID